MFDIKKFTEANEAKKDPFSILANTLKRNDAIEPYSRKHLRNMNGYKMCGRTERQKLINKLSCNNVVIIGDLTLNQSDNVHLMYKYSNIHSKLKNIAKI